MNDAVRCGETEPAKCVVRCSIVLKKRWNYDNRTGCPWFHAVASLFHKLAVKKCTGRTLQNRHGWRWFYEATYLPCKHVVQECARMHILERCGSKNFYKEISEYDCTRVINEIECYV